MVAFVYFQQLVRRARAVAVLLRALHIRIINMFNHPLFAGLGSLHRLECGT